jgi:hypothetical protein
MSPDNLTPDDDSGWPAEIAAAEGFDAPDVRLYDWTTTTPAGPRRLGPARNLGAVSRARAPAAPTGSPRCRRDLGDGLQQHVEGNLAPDRQHLATGPREGVGGVLPARTGSEDRDVEVLGHAAYDA